MAKKRSEFDSKYKWRTKDLYISDEACKKDIKSLEGSIKKIKKYKGKLLESANTLYEALELDTKVSKKLERVYIYAHINNDADTLDNNYQELYGLAKNIYIMYLEATSFMVPELLNGSFELIKGYIKEVPELKVYKRSLKEIFRMKKHTLSDKEESILSSLSKLFSSPDEIMGALTDSDFKFKSIIVDGKEKELTESNYSVYLRSEDRDVRKQAFENIHSEYGKYKNTLATTLRSEVDKNVAISKLRGYSSSLDRALFANEIDKDIYTNLIESVHDSLPVLDKYWRLKKKLLKLDEMHIYDTYADIPSKENSKWNYEEAKDVILKAVSVLGNTYKKDITKAFDEGWIDSCANIGKRGGAYCTACYSVHPYVLMSYEGLLNDVSTLAHELGHAMHYYYACKYQNYQDYNYSIFVAEVASQVNEILLCRYLLDNSSNKEEKIKIIDDLLQKYKSTIFRQTMFAEFELFIHEWTEANNVLTSQNMCDKYLELNKLYYGSNVVVDDLIKYEWERIPHFYMNFYVYQYSTAFAAAVKIANDIYNGNVLARDNYLKFLTLGSSKTPIDSLKVAGLDMKSPKVMQDAIAFMNELIDEYNSLQGSDINE